MGRSSESGDVLSPADDRIHEVRAPRFADDEFWVRGHLGETVLSVFPRSAGASTGPDTMLTGTRPDQAALHGVLAEFAWFGLELLGIRRLPKLPESGDANSLRGRRD